MMQQQQQALKQEEAFRFLQNVPSSRNTWTKHLPGTTEHDNTASITTLQEAYHHDNLVLVLGAGVSLQVGLPSWDTLLNKLMARTIEEEGPLASDFFAKVFSSLFRPNALVLGRYLNQFYESRNINFSQAIRQTLYAEFQEQTFATTSDVLKEIVRFCIAPGRAPNLNAIITYNYDDIVEQLLRESGMGIPFRSIYALGDNPGLKELPIYHVHGFLPFEGDVPDLPEITFGENVYHKQYSDTYSWNNMVQINKFRDTTCLFIGSSLTDPNIRRLLDIAKAQRGNRPRSHFAFKKRYLPTDIGPELSRLLEENKILLDEKIKASLDLEGATEFLCEVIHAYEENDARSFGVEVIWVDKYDEIPQLLEQIRTEIPHRAKKQRSS